MEGDRDFAVRMAAFRWLAVQVEVHGEVLPRQLLAEGFEFDRQRVPLLGPQGIFKPRLGRLPLSITTIPGGPYRDDGFRDDRLEYAYRGTDANHSDNVGLRVAGRERTPLVLFYRLTPGSYLVWWPVFVVKDDPVHLRFDIALEEPPKLGRLTGARAVAEPEPQDPIERRYVISTFRRRLHQQSFRERVLRAYQDQCALCRLRHQELLDAAHIVADAEDEGDPVVPNGLALCKLHHAAFDSLFLTVRPDHVIEVRPSILAETDGPMLIVGLKGMHERRIVLPRSVAERPDPARLERHYERFRLAS